MSTGPAPVALSGRLLAAARDEAAELSELDRLAAGLATVDPADAIEHGLLRLNSRPPVSPRRAPISSASSRSIAAAAASCCPT